MIKYRYESDIQPHLTRQLTKSATIQYISPHFNVFVAMQLLSTNTHCLPVQEENKHLPSMLTLV